MFRHACAHGPRRHRLEARRLALQVGRVRELGEGQEPGLRAAVSGTRTIISLAVLRWDEVSTKERHDGRCSDEQYRL